MPLNDAKVDATFHGDAFASFFSRMVAIVLRRLRDLDSAVRTACVDAVTAMSACITRPPFSASFLRPLLNALAQEQDANAQISAAADEVEECGDDILLGAHAGSSSEIEHIG